MRSTGGHNACSARDVLIDPLEKVTHPSAQLLIHRSDQLGGGLSDHCDGLDNRRGAGGCERVVVTRRNDAADGDRPIVAARVGERRLQLQHQARADRSARYAEVV